MFPRIFLKKSPLIRLYSSFPILSMGMSGDYANAIAAGSTIVRVGTVVFGKSSAAV